MISCSDITETIKSDFGALWTCRQVGESLEVSTPYLLPNDDALTVYISEREDRIIVSDGGFLDEYLGDEDTFNKSKLEGCTDYLMAHHGVKSHMARGGRKFFFKEASSVKLVPSVVFDIGNFVVALCNTTLANLSTEEIREEKRFASDADAYMKTLLPRLEDRKFKKKVPALPHVRFGAVISSNTHLWLVGYVTGSTPSAFIHNIGLAHLNFVLVKKSSVQQMATMIALVNDKAAGYREDAQSAHIAELHDVTAHPTINWTDKDKLLTALSTFGAAASW